MKLHDELRGNHRMRDTDRIQIESWALNDGVTEADVDDALAEIRGWAQPPDAPWEAFRAALGKRVGRRHLRAVPSGPSVPLPTLEELIALRERRGSA